MSATMAGTCSFDQSVKQNVEAVIETYLIER